MSNETQYEDLELLAKQGKRPQGRFLKVKIDDEVYKFDDPIVSGRQLLLTAGKKPIEEHLLYFIDSNKILEDIGLEESIDLRERGIERFITFESDRSFRFELDSQRQDWGASIINESTLKKLASVPTHYRVWLENTDSEDELLSPNQMINLAGKGVERFYTGSPDTTAGDIKLPISDQLYLDIQNIEHEVVAVSGQIGIIFKNYFLGGAVTPGNADVLIMLPQSYPDTHPDMFYTEPWVSMKSGGWPEKADHPFDFNGRRWQRWSRHNSDWRPGIDGIRTMLRRIDFALGELKCVA